MGELARGYSWPAFKEGNEAALKAGAFSARKIDPIAAELAAGIVLLRPDLDDQQFFFAVHAWARAEARCILFADWLVDRAMADDDGEPLAALTAVARFEKQAADLRARLGLDPRARAELDRHRVEAARSAVDLDAVRTAGRNAIEARASEHGADGSDVADELVPDERDLRVVETGEQSADQVEGEGNVRDGHTPILSTGPTSTPGREGHDG